MPRATYPKPKGLNIGSLMLLVFALTAACSGGSSDPPTTPNGAVPSGGSIAFGGSTAHSGATGGAVPSGGSGSRAPSIGGATLSGGTGATGTGGAMAVGGQTCIPANPDGPADHATSGYESQPCSDCHKAALSGGIVYNPSGAATVAQATVTITPTDGTRLTAVTGSSGLFVFRDSISAPYVACVSKCPDTRCAKSTDHPSVADCGTCHGVTTPKIHLP